MNRAGMLLAVCTVVAACDGGSLVDAISSTESELQTAQCTNAAQNGCFATFEACTGDAATCEAALRACLPPRPQHDGDGGCRGGHGGPDGGRPPPGGPGGPGGHGGHRPPLSEACRTALETCLDAAPAEPRTCFDAARTCMQAEFQARCDEAAATCAGSTDEACVRLLARCEAGVGAVPAGTACEDSTGQVQ